MRSGGPSLKSSAAYTKSFAEWVFEQHTKANGWCGILDSGGYRPRYTDRYIEIDV